MSIGSALCGVRGRFSLGELSVLATLIGAGVGTDVSAEQRFSSAVISGMTNVVGINDSGYVLGDASYYKDGVWSGTRELLLWRDGALTHIEIRLEDNSFSHVEAVALNSKNQILGRAVYADKKVSFIWDAGAITTVSCPDYLQCTPYSLSDNGVLTGFSYGSGIVWQNGVAMLAEDLPGGLPRSNQLSVSHDGTVFVSVRFQTSYSWKNGVSTPIPFPPAEDPVWGLRPPPEGYFDLYARNRNGSYAAVVNSHHAIHLRDGRATTLGAFPESDSPNISSARLQPAAINDLDWIVGYELFDCEGVPCGVFSSALPSGFIWTFAYGLMRLGDALVPGDPLSWVQDSVFPVDVNSSGLIVAKWFLKSEQVTKVVILAPRPPRFDNDLLLDFGPQYGIWRRANDRTWVGVHSVSARQMAVGDLDNDGRADALFDFGPQYGIWALRNGTTWEGIHEASSQQIVATDLDNNGKTDFVINFGNLYGLWAYMDDGTWKGLHSVAPRQVLSAKLDRDPRRDLVVDFGPRYGIWLYMNNSTWVALHGNSAKNMVVGDLDYNGLDEIVIDFGPGTGIWIRRN